MINIPDEIKEVFEIFYQKKYQCYIVGGYVRDSLMGIKSTDIDLCTDAHPDTLMKLFSPYLPKALYPYGISFKTGDYNVEVSTMRLETYDSKGRHPKNVSYTKDIVDDVLRRDFTMNALYYSPKTGIVDICGGLEDINNKLIKMIGNSSIRFKEDPVRILRLVAFQSRFGFDIDDALKNEVFASLQMIDTISNSQMAKYFKKILLGDYIKAVRKDFSEVLEHLVPELTESKTILIKANDKDISLFNYIFELIQKVDNTLILRYLAFFHRIGNVKHHQASEGNYNPLPFVDSQSIAKKYFDKFEVSKRTQKRILHLIEMIDSQDIKCTRSMQRFIYEYGFDSTEDYLRIKKGIDEVLGNTNYRECLRLYQEVVDGNLPVSPTDLEINIDDLVSEGIPVHIAKYCLNYAFVAYLSGQIENHFFTLKDYCKEIYHDQYQLQKI